MDKYITELTAICVATGELITYAGPHIESISWDAAQEYCDIHYPYLKVKGKLVYELTLGEEPIDYDKIKNN